MSLFNSCGEINQYVSTKRKENKDG